MSFDPAFTVLLPFLQQQDGKSVWIADENALEVVGLLPACDNMDIVSNRLDVVAAASASGHSAIFSDFNFSGYAPGSVQRIIYRISKEKPVVHHVLNHAYELLVPGGELWIAGLKTDGTKTYIEKCKSVFGNGSIEKSGAAYLGHFRKSNNVLHAALLDDQDYASLRMIQTPALDFYSKPGVFGWNRIDQGSAFLLDALPDCLKSFPLPPQSLLDLGCGYGYLTLMTRDLPFSHRVATDNNAAALLAMRCNADHYGINVDVMPADAGDALDGLFDLVLCNPPFHQGFSVAGDLTDKFLRGARRLLSPQGKALFVVNQFVGLERKAGAYFSVVDVLANNSSFKVVRVQV